MPTRLCAAPHYGTSEHTHKHNARYIPYSHDFKVALKSKTVGISQSKPTFLNILTATNRKISITLRMALPFAGVILTCCQMPIVISRLGEQQFRSLFVSFDILLTTFTANAIVLGSLLQDRGYKKTKYKHGDAKSGFNTKKAGAGRDFGTANVLHNRWDSDEDLMRTSSGGDKGSMLIGLEELQSPVESGTPDVPPKAKFSEIRVASTWEIQVNKREAKE